MTGVAVIPVSVAELQISLGRYELSGGGEVVETGRADEKVVVPLAHTEGGPDSVGAARRAGGRRVGRLPRRTSSPTGSRARRASSAATRPMR